MHNDREPHSIGDCSEHDSKISRKRLTLIDSERRSKDNPDTWAHPPQAVLDQIEPGYFVKVGVTHAELSGERFWGLVKERKGAGIVLQVDQDMIHSDQHGVSDQDVLIVQEQNISGIVDGRGVSVWVAKELIASSISTP